MDTDTLGEVIKAEKEIQDSLEREKIKAFEWLDNVRKESEKEYSLEREKCRELSDEEMKKAHEEAEASAAGMLADAEERASKLENMTREVLAGIIIKHMNEILPG